MPTLKASQELKDAILKDAVLNMFYPVGSYYETSDLSFDPNKKWGGTWVTDSGGRVTVSIDASQTEFNTIGKTGGSKLLHKHGHGVSVYGENNTNSGGYHGHQIYLNDDANFPIVGYPGWAGSTVSINRVLMNQSNGTGFYMYAGRGGTHSHYFGLTSTGSASESGNGDSQNLQPYVVVRRWHRTK